jgi:hypothetical protein
VHFLRPSWNVAYHCKHGQLNSHFFKSAEKLVPVNQKG